MFAVIRDRLDAFAPREAVELGTVLASIVAIGVWATIVAIGYTELVGTFPDPSAPVSISVAAFVPQVFGISLGALVYMRLRGLDINTSLPRLDLATLAVIIAPVVAVGVVSLVGTIVGVHVSTISQTMFAPRPVALGQLLFVSVLPQALAGVGYGLLVAGVMHETIRDRVAVSPDHAIGITTAVFVFVRFTPIAYSDIVTALSAFVDTAQFILLTMAILTSIGFGAALGLVYRAVATGNFEEAVALRYSPMYAFGAFGLFAMVSEFGDLLGVAHNALFVIAAVSAVYGYERTRSLWVPVATFVLFTAAIPIVAYLEAVLIAPTA